MTHPTTSARALEMIVGLEVTSQAVYTREDSGVTWPGGASGCTVGIGYDLGYHSATEVRQDWQPHLAPGVVLLLCSVAGLVGQAARAALPTVRSVRVPFDAAEAVFRQVDVPRTEDLVRRTFVVGGLTDDQFGALVSLVYNRGASCSRTDPRRREMWQIQDALVDGRLDLVPGLIRSMERLWVGGVAPGLVARREQEAALFESGGAEAASPPAPPPVPAPPPAAVPQPALTADQLNQEQLDAAQTQETSNG
jgi:hypothetical protein